MALRGRPHQRGLIVLRLAGFRVGAMDQQRLDGLRSPVRAQVISTVSPFSSFALAFALRRQQPVDHGGASDCLQAR